MVVVLVHVGVGPAVIVHKARSERSGAEPTREDPQVARRVGVLRAGGGYVADLLVAAEEAIEFYE
ncbi:hypothetical protein FoTM2_001884 [Fusarium oxysporum f. sp. vasinfectum]|nr:hypothetical protein FoTM2_015815 [Fusarium oxysporum f. sp. vasinfectum]KAK2938666.1 hypothetical protein FoTM2_001884 [Fusarium oxysporum f. sp. vasinfectum]